MMNNQKGSTLVEAMVAIAVLTIGIMATIIMQGRAINASTAAINRTEANSVSLALIETFAALPFDDANLNNTTATAAEIDAVATRNGLQALIDAGRVRTLTGAGFPEMQTILRVPAGAQAGMVVDGANIAYQLAWAVLDVKFNTSGDSIEKNVVIFMYWDTVVGSTNSLQMTMEKYVNQSLI